MTIASDTFDWTDVASSWDERRHHIETMRTKLTHDLTAGLAIRPGEHVLELGAGTGELALRLGEQVGPTGSVLATDVAPGMVELLRRTLTGTANITAAVQPKQPIPFEELAAFRARMPRRRGSSAVAIRKMRDEERY